MHHGLADLLANVCAGPLLLATDLPAVPEVARRPARAGETELFDSEDAEDNDEA